MTEGVRSQLWRGVSCWTAETTSDSDASEGLMSSPEVKSRGMT